MGTVKWKAQFRGSENGPSTGLGVNPDNLHIRSLKVRNFKGIGKLDLSLDESLTLLAGINGVGKTSAIEAILGAVTRAWNRSRPYHEFVLFSPSGDLVRYGVPDGGISLELGIGSEHVIACQLSVKAEGIGGPDYQPLELANQQLDKDSPRPLVVYYDQNRIGGLDSKGHRSHSDNNRESALNTTPKALSDFKSWYYEKESDAAREAVERGDLDYVDPEVEAVREILEKITDGSAKLRSRKPDGSMDRALFLTKKDGFDIPFEALSGGEKAFFLLAIDLARRLLLEFPGKTIAEAPGFVCIDEIELHLHPAWQRQILTQLMDLFPCCQFVVSTHSPQVIGSVSARNVRLLESDDDGNITVTSPIASKGRDSNYVLEGIMNTPEQDSNVDELFDRFDRLVDSGKYEEANSILDKLDELIEGNSSRVSVRRAKCGRLRKSSA